MGLGSFKLLFLFLIFFAGQTFWTRKIFADEVSVISKPANVEGDQWLDIRIRPLAAAQEIPGAEIGFKLFPRFEIGPSIHFFQNVNDVRESAVSTWEIGLKATYLVYSPSPYKGAYLSLGLFEYISQVSSLDPLISTNHFPDFGCTLTAGYQWNLGDLKLFKNTVWTARVGGGVGYRDDYLETLGTPTGPAPYGLERRLEPTLELTLGIWI
jgi:hypothetical protein